MIFAGIAIAVGLSLMPVTPASEEAVTSESTAADPMAVADSLVDAAILALESGSMPPMQAIMQIRDVADRFPENLKAQFTLGVMSLQTGQNEKARDRMNKVLALDPEELEAYRILARAQLALGQKDSARLNLQKALDLSDNPEKSAALEAELAEIL